MRTLDAWVGGELGLARFDGRRFHPVTLRGGRLLSNVSGIVVTAEGDLWLSTSEGAIRIVADEVRQLSADPRHTFATIFSISSMACPDAERDSAAALHCSWHGWPIVVRNYERRRLD